MEESKVTTADVMSLLDMLERNVLSMRLAKTVLEVMAEEGKTPAQIISEGDGPKHPPSEEHIALVRALIDLILKRPQFLGSARLTKNEIIKNVMLFTAGKAHPMAIQIVLKERKL